MFIYDDIYGVNDDHMIVHMMNHHWWSGWSCYSGDHDYNYFGDCDHDDTLWRWWWRSVLETNWGAGAVGEGCHPHPRTPKHSDGIFFIFVFGWHSQTFSWKKEIFSFLFLSHSKHYYSLDRSTESELNRLEPLSMCSSSLFKYKSK